MTFNSSLRKAKHQLRLDLKYKLSQMTRDERNISNSIINENLLLELKKCTSILCFYPLPSEPNIKPSIEYWLRNNFEVSLPRLHNGKIHCHKINHLSENEFIKSDIGVLEPNPNNCEMIPEESISNILIPGLGFSDKGQRIGRGGGIYDKFLSTCSPGKFLIGVCFNVQFVDEIPIEKHDQLVSKVISG